MYTHHIWFPQGVIHKHIESPPSQRKNGLKYISAILLKTVQWIHIVCGEQDVEDFKFQRVFDILQGVEMVKK